MNWLDKLERKFGRYAIRNLPLYIVMLYAIGAVLNIMTKGSYYYYVALNPYMILHGQVWRLLGFLSCTTECQRYLYYICVNVLLLHRGIAGAGVGSIPF